MSNAKIEFESKITIKEKVSAAKLIALLAYLTKDLGFTLNKIKSDELELVGFFDESRSTVTNDMTDDDPQEVTTENTDSEESNDYKTGNITGVKVEIEIEISDNEVEIEIESVSMEAINILTKEIAEKLDT